MNLRLLKDTAHSYIRSDLSQLASYIPHPGGASDVIVDCLDTNESPLDLPDEIKSKLARAYQSEIAANRYPDGSHYELKSLIAEYVSESANLTDELTTANISVGNGSDELIRSLLIATCLGGEGSILVPTPTFSMYSVLAQALRIPVVTIARGGDMAIDLKMAQSAIETTNEPPIRVVFMVHPNSPTGNALRTQELEWLRSLPEDILVVVDEAYFEFVQTSTVRELQRSNWMVLRTFSKAFRLAAHRVGYAVAHPELIAVLEKIRLPYNLPSFSQAAAKVALQQRQLILPLVEQTNAERERVYSILQADKRFIVWPSQANFLYLRLADIGAEQDELLAKIIQNMKAAGTLIRHTGGGLRITIGTKEENDRTLTRLNKLTID